MPADQQEPIEGMESARVKFAGMSLDELGNPPEIDDVMEFYVKAVCTGRGVQRMRDGELRRTARMEVLALQPQGKPVKPQAEPNLYSVDEDD
ncbi:MAG: hypothetical protein ACRDQ1_17785 [Sciscionella sp.]